MGGRLFTFFPSQSRGSDQTTISSPTIYPPLVLLFLEHLRSQASQETLHEAFIISKHDHPVLYPLPARFAVSALFLVFTQSPLSRHFRSKEGGQREREKGRLVSGLVEYGMTERGWVDAGHHVCGCVQAWNRENAKQMGWAGPKKGGNCGVREKKTFNELQSERSEDYLGAENRVPRRCLVVGTKFFL